MGPRAMTLIELAVVMAVVAALAIAAYPVFAGRQEGLDTAANLALEDLRATQRQAMADGAPRAISFTAGSAVYSHGREPGSLAPLSRDVSEAARGVVFEESVTVTFNFLGEPAGLPAPLTITLSQASGRAAITVHPFTGYAARQAP